MRIIDTSGQQCPTPLVATKRILSETLPGDSFQIITDNRTSFNNISRFLTDNKAEFTSAESAGVWTLTIKKTLSGQASSKPEEYCTTAIPHFTRGNFVIAISSDRMGEGAEELGLLLMGNFIKAIKDLDTLPEAIVFYNKGVALGAEGSPVVDDLKEIEKMGVRLLLCATCAKYYSLEEKIKIGTISNLYEITQVMVSAGSVIKP